MYKVISALAVALFCCGCSFSPAEKQCRKELALQGQQLKAKAIATCVERVRALEATQPERATCVARCVDTATDDAALQRCVNRCPVAVSRR